MSANACEVPLVVIPNSHVSSYQHSVHQATVLFVPEGAIAQIQAATLSKAYRTHTNNELVETSTVLQPTFMPSLAIDLRQ